MTGLATLWASLPTIDTVKASGDGRLAFWSWGGLADVAEIYMAPTDGSAAPRRLTHGTDHATLRDVNYDGSRAIIARSRNACEHDQLFLLDVAGCGLTVLTPEQRDYYLYGGQFARDGGSIIFLADFDYDAGRVTAGALLWRQDLATGARSCLLQTSSAFEKGAALSPEGSRLLWQAHNRSPGATQIWVMGTDGAAPREVLCLGDTSTVTAAWRDDATIAFVADGPTGDRLGLLHADTGAIDWLADDPAFHPHDVVTGHGGLACVAHDAARTHAELTDGSARRALPNSTGRRSLLPHAALPGGAWLAEAYDADGPHALFRIAADGAATLIAAAPPAPARRFSRPRDCRWTATDGTPLQGWLYLPDGPSRGLVMHVHGGPTWHSEDWANPQIGFLVQAGFTVLDPNYRGSTGFGMAHREAVKHDGWGGAEQTDIRDGILALLADGLATPGRIAVAGNSYGGFSSWVAITRFADLVTAAIPMCGMYRLDIDYHATEMPHGRAYSEAMMGGTPDQLPEKYARASPGHFIDRIRGHVMIVHGLADSNVGPENTHIAVRELTAAGIPHRVMLFDDEGHGVARAGNMAAYFAAAAAFLTEAFDTGPWR